MGRDIGKFYKYSLSQLSTLSIKVSIRTYLDPQTSSAIEFKKTYVPSVRDKKQNNYVLYS